MNKHFVIISNEKSNKICETGLKLAIKFLHIKEQCLMGQRNYYISMSNQVLWKKEKEKE